MVQQNQQLQGQTQHQWVLKQQNHYPHHSLDSKTNQGSDIPNYSFTALTYPTMPDQSAALMPRPIVTHGDGLLNIATTEPSLAMNSMSAHRYSGYQPLLPVKESPLAPKVEPRTKFDLSMSNFPGKTRKRHKVATSCNRCRQNKRKCDSGIPCSNCKRNKADCLYTDAQQSRSTWGDSPLSKEKIIGVSTADLDKDTQSQASQPAASSPSSSVVSKTSKAQTKPSSASKKSTTSNGVSVQGKGPISQMTSQPVPFSTATLQFNPGHVSSEQGSTLDKRREMLAAQSVQIAKTIRVAQPGPQLDLSGLLLNESISTAIPNHRQPTHVTQSVPSIGPESSQTGLSGVATNLTGSAIHNLSSQSAPKTAWQQDPGVGQVSSPPQPMFNGPQIRQTSLDQQVGSTRSPSTRPLSPYSDTLNQEHSPFTIGNNTNQPNTTYSHQISNQSMSPQQQFQLPYAENGVSETKGPSRASTTITVSSFVPTQNGLNTISQGFGGGSHTSDPSFSTYQRNPSSIGSEVGGSLAHEQHQVYQRQYEPQQQHNMGAMNSNAVMLLQDHQPSSVAQFDLNHAISSAAPVSPTVMSSQPRTFSPLNNTPLYRHQDQVEWKDSNLTRLPSGYPSLHSVLQNASAALPQSTVTAYAPIIDTGSTVEQGQALLSQDLQSEERIEVARMQRIAKSMIDCKNYDYSILLPRHISQEYDEMWVVPHSNSANDLQGMPRQLLVLPKDANYLVDVFFEHSYYYYPIVNRAVVESHLMEPQTPHSLFLLNIVFMAACKHLARNSDIKRAIQFRERAHEIQPYIDVRVRITMIQGAILGAQVTYGVFHPVLGVTQMFGSRETFTSFPDGAEDKGKEREQEGELKIDLAAESRSIAANKNLIPESVYQQRLWTFWGLYARDCMAKLYFGWSYGLDGMDFSPELPKIKGTVGLGGMKRNSSGQDGLDGQVTGKRRGAAMNIQQLRREKKLMKAEKAALAISHDAYRMSSFNSDDDEDEEDELEDQEDESDTEQDDFDVLSSVDTKTRANVTDKNQRSKWTGDSRNNNNNNNSAGTSSQSKENTISFSGLSKPLLEKQSRGEDLSRRQGSGSRSTDIRRHLERMKLLLDAESDVTDGGTYSRVLFLEEVKLWTIGRRVGLYLQGRDTSLSVSPAAAATAVGSPYGLQRSVPEGSDPFTSTISASLEASKCSERAWLEDKELQSLQADLIAWEQALPPIFKFRSDVDADDINHKLNGKLGIIAMYYYTITILLQSSYLPIPQYLSSPSRSSPSRSVTIKSPESLSQEYDGMFSRAASLACSDDSGPRIKSETEEYFHTGRSPQPSSNGYFNTAHQICTQLSNVVYHHVELLLDRYQEWCTIQAKLNHTLTAALRVSCLNARLSSNSRAIRDEAKAGFKMGSELFKRQATIPAPLTIRDWPAEEDVMKFKDLEEGFRELMTTQDDEEAAMEEARSRSQTRDSEGLLWGDDPGDHLLYSPDFPDVTGTDVDPYLQHGLSSLDTISSHYDMFRAEHVFGLSDEGFQFDYNVDA